VPGPSLTSMWVGCELSAFERMTPPAPFKNQEFGRLSQKSFAILTEQLSVRTLSELRLSRQTKKRIDREMPTNECVLNSVVQILAQGPTASV
jgi:hypothetical protein